MPDYRTSILGESPTGFWYLDEYRGITTFDFSGNARNLTISGTPTLYEPALCSDWPGGSMKFLANGDRCEGAAAPFIGNGKLTILGFIKPLSITQAGCVVRCGENDNMVNYALYQQNGSLRYRYYNGSALINHDSDPILVAGTRTHFALTRASDGKTVKFYVNGVQIGSSVVAAAVPAPGAAATKLLIGGLAAADYLPGWLDEIAVIVGTELPDWKIANIAAPGFRVWPISLPNMFSPTSYEETIADQTVRSPMTQGPPKTRPGASAAITIVKGSLDIDDSQRDDLETLFYDTLYGGSLTFEASLRGESSPGTYLFTSPPAFHDLESGDWEASLDFVVLP